VINALIGKLDGIDLKLISDELDGVADEVKKIIAGLDPRPIIAQLQGLVDEVKGTASGYQLWLRLSEMNVRAFVGCWPIAQSFAPLRQAAGSNVATDMTDDRVFLTRQPVNARMKKTHGNEVNISGHCFRMFFISAARKELFNASPELPCRTNRQQFKWSSD